VGGSYCIAPFDCYEREFHNGMVPQVFDYEREVSRFGPRAGRFVEPYEIPKTMVKNRLI